MGGLKSALRGKRLQYLMAFAMTVVFVLLRTWDPLPLQLLRLKTFDMYQRAQPRETIKHPVAIIDLDEESLAAYGQWPWPRTLVAELVTKLMAQGVAVIGFDMVFAEPDRTSPAVIANVLTNLDAKTSEILANLPSNDAEFAAVLRRSRVVLGQSTAVRESTRTDEEKPIKSSVGVKGVKGVDPKNFMFAFRGLVRNLRELEQAASGIGLFTLRPEIDGVVRRVPMVVRVGKQLYPSLTIEMLRVALGRNGMLVIGDEAGISGVRLSKILYVPTDRNGRTWVNFARHDRSRYVSAKDVLDGTVPPGRLRGHLVIFGTSAVGLFDIKTTPVDDAMPGVEIHAQLLENILEDMKRQGAGEVLDKIMALPEDQRDPAMLKQIEDQLAAFEARGPAYLTWPHYDLAAELTALITMCALIAGMVLTVGAVLSLLAYVVVASGLGMMSWYLYTQHGVLLDVAYIAATGFLLYSMLTYLSYVREESERRQVRDAFGHYMSPALVEQLAENPDQLQLGGEMRDMTLLFADVRGFTSISELYKSDPRGLTRLINRFLTPTTNVILDRLGTIDKYMGDCIMAFWNAPLDDDNHAGHACESALAMMVSVNELNETLEAEAEDKRFIPIKIGIGLNSGECRVGNMGSEQRFDYSVLGDDVNLALRLEGQSKTYGVDIVIGENTRRRAPDYAYIELDLIKVKGKNDAVRVFALMGEPDKCDDDKFQALSVNHAAMLEAYRDQRWDDARTLSAECRQIDGGIGGLYDLYNERIDDYEANPPGGDWDGVFVATTM